MEKQENILKSEVQDSFNNLTAKHSYGSPEWKLVVTNTNISLVPIPMPWCMYIILDILLPTMGLVFSCITKNFFFFWFMIFVAILSHIFLYLWLAHNLKLGPYLLWDKKTGKVDLPREKASLNAKDIVEFRHIAGPHGLGSYEYESIAELNIIAKKPDDSLIRYSIVGGIPNELLKKVSKPLSEATGIPLKIIKLTWAQRQVLASI